jgi:hypothetical protein
MISFEDISVQSVTFFVASVLPLLPPTQRRERRSSTSKRGKGMVAKVSRCTYYEFGEQRGLLEALILFRFICKQIFWLARAPG